MTNHYAVYLKPIKYWMQTVIKKIKIKILWFKTCSSHSYPFAYWLIPKILSVDYVPVSIVFWWPCDKTITHSLEGKLYKYINIKKLIKNIGSTAGSLGSIETLPLTSYFILEKLFKLFVLKFPYLK